MYYCLKRHFLFHPATLQKEVNIISKMKNNYSRGLENIPNKLSKFDTKSYAPCTILVFIELGQIPDVPKIGKILPLQPEMSTTTDLPFFSATLVKNNRKDNF